MRVPLPLLSVALTLMVLPYSAVTQKPDWEPRYLGNTSLRHAAFMEAYFSEDETLAYEDRWSVYVSTFDPGLIGQFDRKYYIRSPGRYMDSIETWDTDILELLDVNAYWPNNPDYMPSSVGGAEGIVWTSGFLVSSKTDGQLQLYDTTQEPPSGPYNIASNDNTDWAYHRVVWKDMDNDGDLDAITSRFFLPLVGEASTQVLYLENPGTGFSEGWAEHIITELGGDVHFAVKTLDAGGRPYDCILLGEFFNRRLSVVWTENVTGDWSDQASIEYRVFAPNSNQPFDVLVEDFNEDGTEELMVTLYDNAAGVGRVEVFFFPADFRTDNFTNIIVAEGFVPNDIPGGGEVMSPGSPKIFYPSSAYANELALDGRPHKPWVMLSGDDDGCMYILYPDTEDRTDWTYQKQTLIDTQGYIAGKMATGDFDNDGYTDVLVAGYSTGKLYLYTYAP